MHSLVCTVLWGQRNVVVATKKRPHRFQATADEILDRGINEKIQLFPREQLIVNDTVFETWIAEDRYRRMISGAMADDIVKNFQLSELLIQLLNSFV